MVMMPTLYMQAHGADIAKRGKGKGCGKITSKQLIFGRLSYLIEMYRADRSKLGQPGLAS